MMSSDYEAKGRHVLVDITGLRADAEECLVWLAENSRHILESEGVTIVGENRIVFDGSSSPQGFTFVLLLDESHFSAHCYALEGLLALDMFTCGGTDPKPLLDELYLRIESKYPGVAIMQYAIKDRFIS